MLAFQDTLETCALIDLGFGGTPFTYDNQRTRHSNVRVHLDRAVTTNAWHNLFEFASVLHVPSPCSDHVSVVVKGAPDPGLARVISRRYELLWERGEGLPDVIKEAWESVSSVGNMAKLQIALSKTMSALKSWSRKFGNVTRELAKSRTQLEELMNMNADMQDIRRVTDRMNELLYQEEMMWLQRSRITWLKAGDRNTVFSRTRLFGGR